MTITERLRAEVVRSKVGLAELARVTGIDRSNLNKFATGKIGMNLENGVVLARAVGVDLMVDDQGVRQVAENVVPVEVFAEGFCGVDEDFPPETEIVHVPREKPKPVPINPRPSTPSSSIPGGPKRADDKRELTVAEKRLRKKLEFGDGG